MVGQGYFCFGKPLVAQVLPSSVALAIRNDGFEALCFCRPTA